jgi:hypothetical protein
MHQGAPTMALRECGWKHGTGGQQRKSKIPRKNALDTAATWKSILYRSKHQRATRINRGQAMRGNLFNKKQLFSLDFHSFP